MSQLDIDLEFALAELPDDVLRRIAGWATLQCLERAGLASLPALGPAIDALKHGEPIPKPLDDYSHFSSVVERTSVVRTNLPAPPNGDYEQSPQDWAIASVLNSTAEDPLTAALEVLACLAFVSGQHGYRQAFAKVRETFPIGQ